jgi:hypothetical protein
MGLMTDLVNLQLGAFLVWFLVKVFFVKQPLITARDRISLAEYSFDFWPRFIVIVWVVIVTESPPLLFCHGTHFPDSNQLTGKLPTEVGHLTNLVEMGMGKSCLPFLFRGGRKLCLNQLFCFAMPHIFQVIIN